MKKSLKIIEDDQKQKNASFLNREAVLANANSVLISQMLDVLRKVESEVVSQIEVNGIQAKKVVNTGINTISLIMLVFLVLTGVLLYLILTDITRSGRYRNELELAKDEAEYHGRAKQRFLSNMSHEIRTPLQSIIGYAELIKQQEYPQSKDIDAIYHSSEHLLQIVNEVLDYNRIISGKFTFSNKVFDVGQLLAEVISVMRPQAEAKSLKMVADFDLKGLKYIYGDPFRLKQILYNLLGNAVKFTQTGEIVLSAFYKRQNENVHFTFIVKDTGIGLSEEDGKVIFNEFEQINTIESEVVNSTGTGLGLTIIKSLVENQGGEFMLKVR
ncbi:sensor histidine kinase [Pedobacter panaciterrae]